MKFKSDVFVLQTCSQLTLRQERQQAAHRSEMDALKVTFLKLCQVFLFFYLSSFYYFSNIRGKIKK